MNLIARFSKDRWPHRGWSYLVCIYLFIFAAYPLVSYAPFSKIHWFQQFSFWMMRSYTGHGRWAYFTDKNGKTNWVVYFEKGKFVAIPPEHLRAKEDSPLRFAFAVTNLRIMQGLRFDPRIPQQAFPWPCQFLKLRSGFTIKFAPYHEDISELNSLLEKDPEYGNRLAGFKC